MALHTSLRRASLQLPSSTTFVCSQCRHASLLRRPKRPYTFTQLITLSDGSTFVHRTTSPHAVYQSNRDSRNSPVWNPSSLALQTAEKDDAGRLSAFRAKYGTAWDATAPAEVMESSGEGQTESADGAQAASENQEDEDHLLDLISSYGMDGNGSGKK